MDTAPAYACDQTGPRSRQPIRLVPLALTEMTERFAFFGMQTLLLLYLSEKLLPEQSAVHVYGLQLLVWALNATAHPATLRQAACLAMAVLAGSANLTPVIVGPLAERALGRRRAIMAGAALMSLGYLLMTAQPCFLLGMLLLIVGLGCFRGNVASEVGDLYGPSDRRREQGFRLFNLSMNLGAVGAPVVCGALVQAHGWRFGFLGSAVGMTISLAVFTLSAPRAAPPRAAARARPPLDRAEWTRTASLALILGLLGVGLVGCEQIYNAYMGWAYDTLRLTAFGRPAPTAWLLSLDTGLSILALCITGPLWRLWRRGFAEPGEPAKIALGFGLVALSYICLALIRRGDGAETVTLVIGFHALNGLGYANIIPVVLSFCTRRAPEGARALLMGLFFLQFGLAMFLSGALARLVGEIPYPAFWSLHAALMAGVGALVPAAAWWNARLQAEEAGLARPRRLRLGGALGDQAAPGVAG